MRSPERPPSRETLNIRIKPETRRLIAQLNLRVRREPTSSLMQPVEQRKMSSAIKLSSRPSAKATRSFLPDSTRLRSRTND